MKYLTYILIVSLPLLGCQKKWKRTSVTNFSLNVITEKSDVDYIKIHEGELYLSSFSLDGTRKKGDDVFFQEEYSDVRVFDIEEAEITPILTYDLPQGEYTSMHIDLRYDVYDTIGSILIYGSFKNDQEEDEPFVFKLQDRVDIHVTAASSNGSNIIVKADETTAPVIEFDLVDWFEQIPVTMFDNADTFEDDGEEVVYISKTQNPLLYSLVLDRIGETATITF